MFCDFKFWHLKRLKPLSLLQILKIPLYDFLHFYILWKLLMQGNFWRNLFSWHKWKKAYFLHLGKKYFHFSIKSFYLLLSQSSIIEFNDTLVVNWASLIGFLCLIYSRWLANNEWVNVDEKLHWKWPPEDYLEEKVLYQQGKD